MFAPNLLMESPEQYGCVWPPLMQKSIVPVNELCPKKPALVWIICTTLASSFVSRNRFEACFSINGRAGSKPEREIDSQSNYIKIY